MIKKTLSALLIMMLLLVLPVQAIADVKVGDSIVTLGANLTEQQKQDVLRYFKANANAQIISVNIEEERHYLGDVVPAAQIGNGTHSCAMITYTTKGSGIQVKTNNINYVTPSAYESALLTAGVNDADVQITAPFEVSGTGALTGIMKAYEVSTGTVISEEVKKAATKEMVTNTKIAESVGEETSTNMINDIKQQVAEERPQSDADVKNIVDRMIEKYNVSLTDAQYQELLSMIKQFSNLDIDWNALSNQLNQFANQASDYLQTEEGQNLLQQLQDLANRFFNWLQDVFSSQDQETNQQ